MITKLPPLTVGELATVAGLRGRSPVPLDDDVAYAGYARFLLRNLVLALGWPAGSQVLVPAYVCDTLVLPFEEVGVEPVYYGTTDRFGVDFDSLAVSPGVRGIVTVSFFGFGDDYRRIADTADRHGLVWIHDNAHGFASCDGRTRLEEIGDVSVTSFRKVISSHNGARLRINATELRPLLPEVRDRCDAAPREPVTRYLVASSLRAVGQWPRSIPDYDDLTGFQEADPGHVRVDPGALRLLAISDEAAIRDRRRALYLALEECVASASDLATPVPGLLRDGSSPQVLPIRVAAVARRPLLAQARRRGLDLHTWPALPAAVIPTDAFGSVTRWREHLFLPLHQRLDPDAYVAVVRELLDAVRASATGQPDGSTS